MNAARLWSALGLALVACAPAPRLPRAAVALSPGDPRVGTYTSSDAGFRTNSFWIEGPTGVVVIDTQFLLSSAGELVDWVEQATGKKVVLGIALHPNPDKFNGAEVFAKRGIEVVTSAQALALEPAVHELRKKWFLDRFKPDYPTDLPPLKSFGDKTTELRAGGLTLRAHVLGAGCSGAHVAIEFEGHLFAGDLVAQGFHGWLELGMLDEWLDRLDELADLEPKFVHPGRGASGGSELLTQQTRYLKNVIRIVRAHGPQPGKKLSAEEHEAILSEIRAAYPAYAYWGFVDNGLDAVWERMTKRPLARLISRQDRERSCGLQGEPLPINQDCVAGR